MKMRILGFLGGVCIALAGCTAPGGIRTERLKLEDGTETQYSYIFVDSGVDAAGGQRIKMVDLYDHNSNEIVPEMRDGASSTGTLQDATNMSITASSAALISGHYYAKGQANRRPDSMNIQQSGGGAEAISGGVAEGAVNVSSNSESTSTSAGGEGGSVAPGAVAVDNSTAVDVVAQGGKGGSTGDIDIGPVTASAKGGNAYSDAYSTSKVSNTNTNTNTLTNRPSVTTNNNIKFEAQPLQTKKYPRH